MIPQIATLRALVLAWCGELLCGVRSRSLANHGRCNDSFD